MDRSTQDITVRPATPRDEDFILALVPQLVAFGPPRWRSEQRMIETDTLVIGRALRGLSPGAAVLVAEDVSGKALGFIHLCAETDYYLRGQCGHIGDVVVSPDARGRGVGEKLLAAAERWARDLGYSLLTLNVFVENKHAQSLYERTGFGAESIRYVKELR